MELSLEKRKDILINEASEIKQFYQKRNDIKTIPEIIQYLGEFGDMLKKQDELHKKLMI